jgi:NADPH-dependent ferric siderophore reductase
MNNTATYRIERVRHELKKRHLQVMRVEELSPHMRRITLGGDDLQDFVSPGYDDHVKLFFADGSRPEIPQPGRNYTPRSYDVEKRELVLDFVLHGEGIASSWASRVEVGQRITVGGPRGSMLVSENFDWYVLIGDQTALPAIARRLEELPATAKAIALIQVPDVEEQIPLHSETDLQVQWLYGEDQQILVDAVKALSFPAGIGYTWAAAEHHAIQAIQQYLLQEARLNENHVKASAYWRRGAAAD